MSLPCKLVGKLADKYKILLALQTEQNQDNKWMQL